MWCEDIPTIFKGIYILGEHQYEDWCSYSIRRPKDQMIVCKFTLSKKSMACISLYQKDKLLFGRKAAYSYSWMRLIVLEKDFDQTYRWVNGKYGRRKNIKVEGELMPGEYFILVMPEWNQDKAYDFHLVIRTNCPIQIERVKYEKGMLEEGCTDLAQRYGKILQISDDICSYNCIHTGIAMIIENINNENMDNNVKIRRKLVKMKTKCPIIPFNP